MRPVLFRLDRKGMRHLWCNRQPFADTPQMITRWDVGNYWVPATLALLPQETSQIAIYDAQQAKQWIAHHYARTVRQWTNGKIKDFITREGRWKQWDGPAPKLTEEQWSPTDRHLQEIG